MKSWTRRARRERVGVKRKELEWKERRKEGRDQKREGAIRKNKETRERTQKRKNLRHKSSRGRRAGESQAQRWKAQIGETQRKERREAIERREKKASSQEE